MRRPWYALGTGLLVFGMATGVCLAQDDVAVSVPAAGAFAPLDIDPLPVVHVRVNDARDAYFLLDTGTKDVVLDRDFARELGLIAPVARLNSLRFGAAVVRNFPVTIRALPAAHPPSNTSIDGILGTSLLRHFLTTIDYPGGHLELRPLSASAVFQHDAATRRELIIPMWLTGDDNIFVRGRVGGGAERLLRIDTAGGFGGVTIFDSAMRDVRASSGTVMLGTLVRTGAALTYSPSPKQFNGLPLPVVGALSSGFFGPYIVTFDFAAMKVAVLAPPPRFIG